jgi:hypothetical protein
MFELMDEARLVESLQSHHVGRGGGPLTPGFLSACVAVLAKAGAEPGADPPTEELVGNLRDGEGTGAIEACVCRIWLGGADGTEELPSLLCNASLWTPIRFLGYRALAFLGRRTTLAGLLPHGDPLELPEADAWMDAARDPLAGAITVAPGGTNWHRLLIAEQYPETNEADLRGLATASPDDPASPRFEGWRSYIASRAAAALARHSLARGVGEAAQLDGVRLPDWEYSYLRGLGMWQQRAEGPAIERLREALARSPQQTCTRLALSCVLSRESPEEALALTEHSEATRDLLIHRAALLARAGRHEEAGEALARPAHWEAPRYSWAEGQEALRRQEALLLTALAEHKGDWASAERHWQRARAAGEKNLLETREFFIASKQRRAAASAANWTRDMAQRKIDRLRSGIGGRPLTGDASFFRSAALLESEPLQALKDLQALRQRRSWREAERCVGGGRVVFVGDALLGLGRPEDAHAAYQAIAACGERRAVASAYARLLKGAEACEWNALEAEAGDSPWPRLLAAVAALVAGNPAAAADRINGAEARGASAPVCRRLRVALAAISGECQVAPGELTATGFPPLAAAALLLAAGTGAEPARAEAYLSVAGERWMEYCPFVPERLARVLLNAWCAEGRWAEALEFAGRLEAIPAAWARELALLTRLRRALEQAVRGELPGAEEGLRRLRDGTVS